MKMKTRDMVQLQNLRLTRDSSMLLLLLKIFRPPSGFLFQSQYHSLDPKSRLNFSKLDLFLSQQLRVYPDSRIHKAIFKSWDNIGSIALLWHNSKVLALVKVKYEIQ